MKKVKTISLRSFSARIFENKKGVSLMISYVLLILISVTVAISIFAWLRLIANVEPVKGCDDGTSIIVSDYNCVGRILTLTIKNNGRFNIDGFILTVGNNTNRVPVTPIIPLDDASGNVIAGQYLFNESFKPNEIKQTLFEGSSVSFYYIRNIRVQPFVVLETGDKIVCEGSIIRQDIEDCRIRV